MAIVEQRFRCRCRRLITAIEIAGLASGGYRHSMTQSTDSTITR
jgi:hypothetical protein